MSSGKQKKLTECGIPTSKKLKTEHTIDDNNLIKEILEARKATASSIKDFKFNKKRVRVLSKAKDIPENAQSILYWMSRDQRVQGNKSFYYFLVFSKHNFDSFLFYWFVLY